MRLTTSAVIAAATACAVAAACSRDNSDKARATDSAATLMPAPAATSPATTGDSIVRGTVKSINDSALTLTTSTGDLHIAFARPVTVYARRNADLSRVTDRSFIGVTSVKQTDGTQRATEIHIFPEALRGLGEGSRPMGTPSGGAASTMTNGSATMTNGSATMTNGSATMTNGASRGTATGGTLTVEYSGGTQTISVPSGVKVTEIATTTTKLAPGMRVTIPTSHQADGSLTASLVMLAGDTARKR